MTDFNQQQKNAIDISKGKFIIANAGSGKTTVLTARFDKIIEQKVEIIATTISDLLTKIKNEDKASFSEINIERFTQSYLYDTFKFDFVVIVSFSEKTVQSLVEKIKNLLLKKKVSLNIVDSPIHYYIYSFLLQNYSNFRITTIHGFCNDIITEYSHELNLDNSYLKKDNFLETLSKEKAFTIINDITYLMLFSESHNILIDGEPIDKTKFENSLLNLYRLNGTFEINNLKNLLFNTSTPVKIYKLNQAIEYLQSKIESLKINLDFISDNQSDTQSDSNSDNQTIETDNLNNVEISYLTRALEFNKFYIYIIKVYNAVLNCVYSEYNLVNFDNQLSLVYEYSKVPENAQKISKKIEHFLIDEFQDTDFIQYEIFKNILDANTDIVPFFVGDPKQSIYRFRSSDVTVFNAARKYFTSNGRTEDVVLDLSYRNAPVVSSFVNSLYNSDNFKNIISKTEFEYNNLVYPLGLFDKMEETSKIYKNSFSPSESKLALNNKEHTTEKHTTENEANVAEINELNVFENGFYIPSRVLIDGRIDYIVGFKTDINKNEGQISNPKYLQLARYIDSLVNDKQIYDYKGFIENDIDNDDLNENDLVDDNKVKAQVSTENEVTLHKPNYITEKIYNEEYPEGILKNRKIEYKDIAVLSRKNLTFNEFDEYFKAYNIPYTLSKSNEFYQLEEIKSAISFLNFINNPEDNEALLILLTSNFYGFELELILHYLEIFSTPNFSQDANAKYFSFWKKLKQIELLKLDNEEDFENYRIVLESKAKAENYNSNSTLYYKKSLDFFKNNPEFIQYIKQILGELELFLIMKNKVFSSELLTMFLKGNTSYNDKNRNTNNGLSNTYYENLNKLVNILHDIESIGFVNYSEVINRLENLSQNEEQNLLESSENAVNFLTFHNSKGLEFPVVIILDSGGSTNRANTEIEKEFGFYTSQFSLDKIDSNLELNSYRSHLKLFELDNNDKKAMDTRYFKENLEKYDTIDKLNLNYVALTRAKNILCFFLHASYAVDSKFRGNDTNKWTYLDLNLKLNSLINQNKDKLDRNSFHFIDFINVDLVYQKNNKSSDNNHFTESVLTESVKIPINYYFFNYTKLKFENTVSPVNENLNLNLNSNSNTNYDTEVSNELNLKGNSNADYSFDTMDTFYSATKLMSVKDGKNKYEFKYILGLDQEFEDEFDKITNKREFDEYYDADFENNQSKSSTHNNHNNTNLMYEAAQFGLAFHFIMQYIVELFPDGKLDFELLDELINEIKKDYKDLSDAKIEEITQILKKLSLSKFILNIISNKENLKTEFNLKMPFLPSKYHFILGNIDLIFKDKNGNYHIIDWKTNRNKNENTKLQYDIQRKLYTYLIYNLDKNAEVNFSLVFTNDILNNDEEYWETKFDTEIHIETIENEIKELISNSLEIEKVLFEN